MHSNKNLSAHPIQLQNTICSALLHTLTAESLLSQLGNREHSFGKKICSLHLLSLYEKLLQKAIGSSQMFTINTQHKEHILSHQCQEAFQIGCFFTHNEAAPN